MDNGSTTYFCKECQAYIAIDDDDDYCLKEGNAIHRTCGLQLDTLIVNFCEEGCDLRDLCRIHSSDIMESEGPSYFDDMGISFDGNVVPQLPPSVFLQSCSESPSQYSTLPIQMSVEIVSEDKMPGVIEVKTASKLKALVLKITHLTKQQADVLGNLGSPNDMMGVGVSISCKLMYDNGTKDLPPLTGRTEPC